MSRYSSSPPVVHTVKGKRLKETDKAILFEVQEVVGITDDEFKVKSDWFPFSQVSKLHWTPAHEDDYIIVSEWILTQKGYDTPENLKGKAEAEKKAEGLKVANPFKLQPRPSRSITQDPATRTGFDDYDDVDIPF